MGSTTQSIQIAAPRERVFAVITDFARYPEFLPEIRSVEIGAKRTRRFDVTFHAKIFVPLQYTLRVRCDPPERVAWTMVRGQVMRMNTGEWELVAQGPDRTTASYTVEITFGPLVPGIVTTTLIGSILPVTLKRFKERIEQWHPTKATPKSRRVREARES